MLKGTKMTKEQCKHCSDGQSKQIKLLINSNGCHECVSHYLCNGYPMIERNYIKIQMSRFVWQEKFGKIPKGLCVLHKCDNPKCINLEHLFLGTKAENIQDAVRKGRNASGFRIWNCKLSTDDIKNIFNSRETSFVIGKRYDVHPSYIRSIKCGDRRLLK